MSTEQNLSDHDLAEAEGLVGKVVRDTTNERIFRVGTVDTAAGWARLISTDDSQWARVDDVHVLTPPQRPPTCPNCGSTDVREWDLVPVPYDVGGIDADGVLHGVEGIENPCWDGGVYDEMMCRDCDHSSKDPLDFYPWRDEFERAQSMIGLTVRTLDGHLITVDTAEVADGGERAWILGLTPVGERFRARPTEITRATV